MTIAATSSNHNHGFRLTKASDGNVHTGYQYIQLHPSGSATRRSDQIAAGRLATGGSVPNRNAARSLRRRGLNQETPVVVQS